MEENPGNTGGRTKIIRDKTPVKPPDKTPNKEQTFSTKSDDAKIYPADKAEAFSTKSDDAKFIQQIK